MRAQISPHPRWVKLKRACWSRGAYQRYHATTRRVFVSNSLATQVAGDRLLDLWTTRASTKAAPRCRQVLDRRTGRGQMGKRQCKLLRQPAAAPSTQIQDAPRDQRGPRGQGLRQNFLLQRDLHDAKIYA